MRRKRRVLLKFSRSRDTTPRSVRMKRRRIEGVAAALEARLGRTPTAKEVADHLGIEWHILGDGFTWESTDLDESAAKGRHAWSVAREMLSSGDYDLLIFDEITYAVKYGWVPEEDVVAAVRERAPKTSVVMTGRDATPGLIEVADTVTEMRKVKHAYDEGIKALKGIEY